jgi:hypothetical protein
MHHLNCTQQLMCFWNPCASPAPAAPQGNTHAKRSTPGDATAEGSEAFRVGSPPTSPGSPLTYTPQVPMEPIAHAHARHEHDSSAQRLGTEFVGAAGWPAQPKLVPVEITCEHSSRLGHCQRWCCECHAVGNPGARFTAFFWTLGLQYHQVAYIMLSWCSRIACNGSQFTALQLVFCVASAPWLPVAAATAASNALAHAHCHPCATLNAAAAAATTM